MIEFLNLRPDSPSLRRGAMTPGCSTRHRAGVGCSDLPSGSPVAVQPAPVPPRKHLAPPADMLDREFLAGFAFGAILLAGLMAALIWGGAL